VTALPTPDLTADRPPAPGGWAYRITVQGRLDPDWSDWYGGLRFETAEAGDGTALTVLCGRVVDQPALRGLLNRLWDLNLTLVAVQRMPGAADEQEADHD
jgi:hypothetical protein